MSRQRIGEVLRYFLRLGLLGFGGPNAHIAMMHEELVGRRGWVSEERFIQTLGATNLIPGPNSSEMAMHFGYERAGRLGGLVAGLAFLAPAFVMVVALSWAYVEFGPTAAREDLLAGIQPAALAAIVVALWKLRSGVVGGALKPTLAAAGLGLTLAFPTFAPLVIVGGGLIGLAVHWSAGGRALSIAPITAAGLVVATNLSGLPALAWVFLRTGLLLFGGGLVLVPLLEPAVVGRGWLTRRQFLDGIAIGQATPGPIVMTAAFVGYLVGGLLGAAVATASIYLPSFAAVLFGSGPLMARYRENPDVAAFVAAVSATALGGVAASALILAPAALDSPFRGVVLALSALALLRRIPVVWVIAGAALIGLAAGAAGLR
jgi:chromate transporter